MSALAPLLTIVGPTGSGKSDLALALARRFDGEILNADSLQVFRGFDIGTAKLPAADRQSPPHHLFDLALLRGLSPGPPASPALRARLAQRPRLHRLLARLDPAAAARIHPNDRNKTLRALEIRLLTGQPSADVFAQGLDALTGYRTLQLGLDPPRHLLYANLDARCLRMWQAGLVEETAHLLTLYPPSAKPFAALGYKQAVDVLAGRLPAPAALAEMQTKTRQYAKRQLTWFRAEPGVVWLPGFGPQPEIVEKSFRATEHFLRSFV
ncbi:MAG: tRNA (adenosine(37)-N6)-dimethylallyltransferase MiaA [Acidobacteria bacterium]|nr:tRNA (adenosine(37)-N6)-dimethylallyltransferase MiaA [Acidobacteriota bacterium]